MARRRLFPKSAVYVLTISNVFISFYSINTIRAVLSDEQEEYSLAFVKAIDDRSTLGLKKEKLFSLAIFTSTCMTLLGGRSLTKNSSTLSGFIYMMDNALTTGPSLSFKIVGRSQGLNASGSQQELARPINGDEFCIHSRKVRWERNYSGGQEFSFTKVREMPVVGGSGPVQFAHGYAEARTLEFGPSASVVEYNVYVLHYY